MASMQIVSVRVSSETSEGLSHLVSLSSAHGYPVCSCPAFRFGDGSPCKHMRYVVERLSAAAVVASS